MFTLEDDDGNVWVVYKDGELEHVRPTLRQQVNTCLVEATSPYEDGLCSLEPHPNTA